MADAAEKEHAEKLAAGRKRFEQLRKQKDRSKKTIGKEKEEEKTAAKEESITPNTKDLVGEFEAGSSNTVAEETQEDGDNATDEAVPRSPPHARQPSLSLQSRMRSSSFRRTSVSQAPLSPTSNGSKAPNLPALSPDGDAVTEIYRKQAFRLDELERENKRLSKEAEIAESRWRKTEEELEELRENSGQVAELKSRAETVDARLEETKKMKSEIASLQRQNTHLQSQNAKAPRHSTSPGQVTNSSADSLQAQLDSKSSTIESMEIEISNLRSQLEKQNAALNTHSSQVAALEGKLHRAESAAGAAQRELLDLRKNLERASEKAVKEGSERTSAETKIRMLGREADVSAKSAEDAAKRVEMLEKKFAALTTLHKEADARRQTGEREREKVEKELVELKKKMVGLENENSRLREERERLHKRNVGGEGVDEGLDELEDEERKRLEERVRELEGEIFDLRRGVWREKRRELQDDEVGSPGAGFDDVDLSGPTGGLRRQSLKGGRGQSFAGVLSSGFSALTGRGERGSLDLVSDDGGFDEDAFRAAQEEEGRRRVERVKEVKRGLKEWEGWRLDIVDTRMAGGGAGEIFDI